MTERPDDSDQPSPPDARAEPGRQANGHFGPGNPGRPRMPRTSDEFDEFESRMTVQALRALAQMARDKSLDANRRLAAIEALFEFGRR